MESEKVIEAILKLPDGADLYGGDMDNPPIVPLKFGTTELKAAFAELRQTVERWEKLNAECEEDSEIWMGDRSMMKFVDGKWRTDGGYSFDAQDNRVYNQSGWDSPLDAFEALKEAA